MFINSNICINTFSSNINITTPDRSLSEWGRCLIPFPLMKEDFFLELFLFIEEDPCDLQRGQPDLNPTLVCIWRRVFWQCPAAVPRWPALTELPHRKYDFHPGPSCPMRASGGRSRCLGLLPLCLPAYMTHSAVDRTRIGIKMPE